MTEQLDSMKTHSSSNDIVLSDDTPMDQSGAFICGESQAVGVAEAALQDGEKKAETDVWLDFVFVFQSPHIIELSAIQSKLVYFS